MSNLSLSARIFIGLAGGLLVGLLFLGLVNAAPGSQGFIEGYLIDGLFELIKKLFINSLKMLVVPLVLVSLICGALSLSDPSKLGRLGGKSIALYLVTTAIAISMALVMAVVFQPGVGVSAERVDFVAAEAPPLMNVIAGIIPANPMRAMADGNMLQVIVFAILFGIAISLAGDRGRHVAAFFTDANEVMLKLVTIMMHLAPYGVFCIMAIVAYELGWDSIIKLASYFFLVIAVLFMHALITYPILLKLLSGLNPYRFFMKIRPALLFGFSTASSAATLPVTMEIARKRLGVGGATSSFTLPLGATINMDGTAIMQGVATVFIAQMYSIDLEFSQYITVIITATMASIGTAGVPGVGLIMLTMVLNQVGLPAEGIAMIIGIDRLLDMTRTAVNITGDSMVACIVSKSEGDFDQEIFNDPAAGFSFERVEPVEMKPAEGP